MVSSERVYEVARRLGVSSRRLLVYLQAVDLEHDTATNALSMTAAAHLSTVTPAQVLQASAHQVPPRPWPFPPFWNEEDHDAPERRWHNWVGPDVLSTGAAAAAYGIRPATVRQWVHRGHLSPSGIQGRSLTFTAHDVYQAAHRRPAEQQEPSAD